MQKTLLTVTGGRDIELAELEKIRLVSPGSFEMLKALKALTTKKAQKVNRNEPLMPLLDSDKSTRKRIGNLAKSADMETAKRARKCGVFGIVCGQSICRCL